jgi:hypothetical protein
MKINFKQIIAKLFFSHKFFLTLLTVALFLFLSSSSYAPTKMSDSDLSDIDGKAFLKIDHYTSATNFWTTPTYGSESSTYQTDSQDVIRISLAVDADVNVHIASFKLGYHNGLEKSAYVTGWDEDMTPFYFGARDRSDELHWKGIFLDFGFDNIGTNATRTLNYIEFGTMNATGQVTATINTVNGLILGQGTGQNNGVMLRQTAAGSRIIQFNGDVLSFVFASKYSYASYNGTATSVSGIFVKMPSYSNSDLTRP